LSHKEASKNPTKFTGACTRLTKLPNQIPGAIESADLTIQFIQDVQSAIRSDAKGSDAAKLVLGISALDPD
jgi:hypothetical protein